MFSFSYPSASLQLPPTPFSLCAENHNFNTVLNSSPEGNSLFVRPLSDTEGQSAGSAGSGRDAVTHSRTLIALMYSFTAGVVC